MSTRILTVALIFALSIPALAAGRPDRGGDHGDHRGPPKGPPPYELLLENADALGLSTATVSAMEERIAAAEPALEAARAEVEAATTEEERHEAMHAMHEAGHGLMDELFALMSDDQVEAAKELLPPPPRPPRGADDGAGYRGCDEER